MTNLKSFLAASAALTLIHGASAGVARRWGTPAGPFCTDFTPFTYAGCFAEPTGGRALPFVSDISTSNMNVQTCVSFCKGISVDILTMWMRLIGSKATTTAMLGMLNSLVLMSLLSNII